MPPGPWAGSSHSGVEMPIDAKNQKPGDSARAEYQAMVARTLRDCWEEPVDTFITGDIPLLLTRLSRIPPVPVGKR